MFDGCMKCGDAFDIAVGRPNVVAHLEGGLEDLLLRNQQLAPGWPVALEPPRPADLVEFEFGSRLLLVLVQVLPVPAKPGANTVANWRVRRP